MLLRGALPLLTVFAAAAAISTVVIWFRWPVECTQTAIGFEPGQPDPNLHSCTTRGGDVVSLDAARVSAVLWGQAAGVVVLVAGALALRSVGQLPAPGLPSSVLGPAVAVLGVALALGAIAAWLLWPGACTQALRDSSEGGRALICDTRLGTELARDSARLTALLWAQGVAVVVLLGGFVALNRHGPRPSPPATPEAAPRPMR